MAIDAIALTLENTCLFGDLLLHLPELSYKILNKQNQWRELINWSLSFATNFYENIIDIQSQKMLSLLEQEINIEKRTADYQNPYYNLKDKHTQKQTTKKPRKQIRKGPQLSSSGTETRIDL